MTLEPGSRLGPYEIISALGAGGMGEVYRARDTRLNRSVAVKVLPSELAGDQERRSRFEREAHAIAALSHPHICTIHDVGRDNGTDYLVMELLEGETLADRLASGSGLQASVGSPRGRNLSIGETLKIATEIADALDKAHRAGIVHRDLKPANIMLTKSGAKLLDFGLAKLKGPAVPISMTAIAHATTMGGPKTATGTILGTVHYMSPEQVEGREADARSDIWALGVVIYEMATGTRPFEGESGASIIGAILKDTPAAISSRQPLTPPALDHIVDRCLDKDPDERWQSAGDVRRELHWITSTPITASAISTPRRRSVAPWIVALGAVALALLSVWWSSSAPKQSSFSERQVFSIALPPQIQMGGASELSPDGSRFVFVGLGADGPPALWLQSLRTGSVQKLAGTDYASLPFWSPAGDLVGFFATGKLKIIPAAGGNARTLATAQNGRGASWSADGTILYVPEPNSPVFRVSDKGGSSTPITTLDHSRGDIGHRWPVFIDDRHFLFTLQSAKTDVTGIYLATTDSPTSIRLAPQYSNAAYTLGNVLYLSNGMIVSQHLDLQNSRLTGDAVEVAGPAAYSGGLGFESFSVASNGVLAYAPGFGTAATSEVRWLDRQHQSFPTSPLAPGTDLSRYNAYFEQLSPDGQTLVLSAFRTATADLWLLDVRRDVLSRFTFDDATELNPVWSPDGTELLFSSNRGGFYNIYRKAIAGSNEESRVAQSASHQYATDWSRDGRTIIFTNTDPQTGADIWMMPASGEGKATAVQNTVFNEYAARLSPDGHWIAYTSDESGEPEVYVQRFPSGSDKRKVSSQGGSEPQWRADGRELFYLAANQTLVSVTMTFKPALTVGRFVKVHDAIIDTSIGSMHGIHYTATPDGQRFLASVSAVVPPTTVVLNWQSGQRP